MNIHISRGTGAPTDTSVAPGTHYIDSATGDHYLFGTTAWQKIGSGGDITIADANLATAATVTLDPDISDTVLVNAPATGNAVLAIDALVAMTNTTGWPRRVHFRNSQPFSFSLSGTASTTQIDLDLSTGFTFDGNLITPPTSAVSFLLDLGYIGRPIGSAANTYWAKFSAQTVSQTLGG